MFNKKNSLFNESFGVVKHWGFAWTTEEKTLIVLWNKAYELHIDIVDKQGKSGISKLQEDTYIKFKENLAENQKNVEQVVSIFFNTTNVDSLISKFIPYSIQINTNGECALIGENPEDEDIHDVLPGLAVIIYPKMAVFTEEAYSEYVFLSGDKNIRRELYDD